MRSSPEGAELLRVARETLLKELLPQLPADSHYPALMVANAMAIASRELMGSTSHRDAERALFRELYGFDGQTETGDPADGPDGLAGRLANDLRLGHFDDRTRRVGELLLREVRERLRISNPKYLGKAGLAAELRADPKAR